MFIQTAYAAGDSANEVGFWSELLSHFWLWSSAVVLFFLSFVIAGFVRKIIMHRIRKSKSIGVHEEVLLLMERAIYFGVLMVVMVIALQVVGIDLTWILGAMSFGLGFAFKDILSNFIGGIVILTQQKMKIGDLIKVGDRF